MNILLNSSTESVEGTALALKRVDDIHGSDGSSARVFGIRHGVSHDGEKEGLQHTTGLLVDVAGNALDTTSTRETADGGLGNAQNVISVTSTVMAFSATFSEAFASFTTSCSSHFLI